MQCIVALAQAWHAGGPLVPVSDLDKSECFERPSIQALSKHGVYRVYCWIIIFSLAISQWQFWDALFSKKGQLSQPSGNWRYWTPPFSTWNRATRPRPMRPASLDPHRCTAYFAGGLVASFATQAGRNGNGSDILNHENASRKPSNSSKMVVLIILICLIFCIHFQYGLDRTGIGSKLFNPTIITICGSLGTSLFDPWSTSYWHISVGFISSSHCIFDSESGTVKPNCWVIERNHLFNPFSLISNM